jgi:hypothetical protein
MEAFTFWQSARSTTTAGISGSGAAAQVQVITLSKAFRTVQDCQSASLRVL